MNDLQKEEFKRQMSKPRTPGFLIDVLKEFYAETGDKKVGKYLKNRSVEQ